MVPLLVAALAAGLPAAPRLGVGIHLDEIGGLSLDDATSLAQSLGEAIERRTGIRPVLDDPLWPACQTDDRCLPAVRDRTRADHLVFIKVFGAPTKIRMIAERLPSADPGSVRFETDLPRGAASWSPLLDGAAERLFPDIDRGDAQPAVAETAAIVQDDGASSDLLWPLSALGASAALLGVGAAFGVSSLRARNAIETQPLSDDAYEDELSRMRSHGRVANVLFGTAGVALVVSIVLFVVSD